LQKSRWMPAFFFSAVNRKRPIGCSILIAGGDGWVTAKRGLFWYMDGELLCFPFPVRKPIRSATIIGGFGKHFRILLPAGCPIATFPVGEWSCGMEKPLSTRIPRSAHRELISGFAMHFRCRMRCRCRSRLTGAGITGVFRRNRRGRLWTFSDL